MQTLGWAAAWPYVPRRTLEVDFPAPLYRSAPTPVPGAAGPGFRSDLQGVAWASCARAPWAQQPTGHPHQLLPVSSPPDWPQGPAPCLWAGTGRGAHHTHGKLHYPGCSNTVGGTACGCFYQPGVGWLWVILCLGKSVPPGFWGLGGSARCPPACRRVSPVCPATGPNPLLLTRTPAPA